MKSLLTVLLFLFAYIHHCTAQDTTILLKPDMYDKAVQVFNIDEIEGWIFKEGNDTAWAKKDIEVNGWKRFRPVEFSAKQADKTGRAAGWFRIKIKLDASLGDIPLGIDLSTWVASDIYINGELKTSSGNTGQNGKPYQPPASLHSHPKPVYLYPGNEYLIAMYVVDYLAPLPPRRLKSENRWDTHLINITGPNYFSTVIKTIVKWNSYTTLWFSVCAILSLLFWLLAYQNPNEKNLRLIAACTSFFALNMLFLSVRQFGDNISYTKAMVCTYLSGLFFTLYTLLMPLILAKIFKRKITRVLKIFLVVYFVISIAGLFLADDIWDITALFALVTVCIYYIISSRKTMKGPSRAIAAGLLLSLLWALLFFFLVAKYQSPLFPYSPLIVTAMYLSFPLSLLVYVAMRFKEIMNEVRQNAEQVVRLSEEKKEQALKQRKLLEEEVARQTVELRNSLENLKLTQSQLIQSEKMASLGELTAGIAHEIQNPLNFVNNFSDVNRELTAELEQEIDKGNYTDAKAIAKDIRDNEEKINHHGKRADAIVKGMLQHSRSSSGQKEPTDINALCDEYLRLAFHGLRAKDKSFNAKFETHLDETVGKINVMPQDIGRVVLNLINNAFYAVSERKKNGETDYEPMVIVTTKKEGEKVLIGIKDNGTGIPQKVLDKIFQPFFTTKPTGQGTGLGLSLSYDIVKAHGGELKVETREGEGTEFTINLHAHK